ncbi:TetR/AcrR family transcriptional regulator [Euzebya sp.]|uniref:TetR/AcrR family transcriptional regulator n=1 Tax=Euzebya sp. TaxID=1971409 RepID=UPI0035187D78
MDEDVAGLGLRERKKRATYQALADAAFELSVERGPDAVTVEDIAAAADVSPRTFFNHFESKEQAILARNTARWARAPRLLADRPDDEDIWTALGHTFRAIYAGEAQERTLLATLAMVRQSANLLSRQRDEYEAAEELLVGEVARRTGTRADDLHPRLVVATAIAAARVAVRRWIEEDADDPVELAVAHALDQVAAGLPAPLPTTA